MIERIAILMMLAALGVSTASHAQCPVSPGWWVWESPNGLNKLAFHVKPGGMEVDTLEYTLSPVCGISGSSRFIRSGEAITCVPWGFTWTSSCNTILHMHGHEATITFIDSETSTAVLDINNWLNNCVACRA